MKKLLLSVSLFTLLVSGCKKEDPVPGNTTKKGDLRVHLRMHTATGPAATAATVSIALSQDSLNKAQYIETMNGDEFGYALFKNISWDKESKHPIFVYAQQLDGGNLLEGTANATLVSDRVTNVQVVLD